MEPQTLGAALLCSSWSGTDLWPYPELITIVSSPWQGDSYTYYLLPCVETKQYSFHLICHLLSSLCRDSNLGPSTLNGFQTNALDHLTSDLFSTIQILIQFNIQIPTVMSYLCHNSMQHFSCNLAAVFGCLAQFVFRLFVDCAGAARAASAARIVAQATVTATNCVVIP